MEKWNAGKGVRRVLLIICLAVVSFVFVDIGLSQVAHAAGCAHATTATSCIEDDGTYYWVANGKIWIQVKKSSGYIVQIHNKTTGTSGAGMDYKSTTTGVWPIGIQTGTGARGTWKAADITSSTTSTAAGTITNGSGTALLQLSYTGTTLKYNDNTNSGVALTVNLNIADGDEYVRINAALNNSGGTAPVRAIYYAGGGDLKATMGSGSNANEVLAMPKWVGGMKFIDPMHVVDPATGTAAFATEKSLAYPSNSADGLTMGWLDLANPNPDGAGGAAGGIGIAYVNKQKLTMEFRLKKDSTGMSIMPVLFDPKAVLDENKTEYDYYHTFGNPNYSNIVLTPDLSIPNGAVANNAFTTDDLIVAPHSGDWHQMADIYRKEYQRVMVDGSGNPDYLTVNGTAGVTGSAISDKAKAIDFLKNRFIGLDNVLYTPFESVPDIVQAQLDGVYKTPGASGANYAFWGAGQNQHGGYASDVPIQVPSLDSAGGNTALTASNDALHAMGATEYYYNHPYAWDTQNTEYTRVGSPIPAANPNQHNDYWNGIWHQTLCVNSSDVQDYWHNSVIPSMRGVHIEGSQFDQASIVNVVCNLSGATSPVSRLQSQIAGIDSLAKMVRNELITGGGSYIESEGLNDLSGRHIDIHTNQINVKSADWGGTWLPELERYALSQFVVHEWPTNDFLLALANGDIMELGDYNTSTAQEYARLKKALRDASAPGYPYGFRDKDGLTIGNTSIIARAFRDDNKQQGTIVYYNSSINTTITTTITVDLGTLGIGSGTKTINVSLLPQTGAFSIIDGFNNDTAGSGAPGWNAVNGAWSVVLDGTNVYKQSTTTTGTLFAATLGSSAAASGVHGDAMIYARVKANNTDATGETSILTRYTDTNNYVQLLLKPAGSTTKVQARIGGVTTTQASAALAVSSNSWYNVKFQVIGNNLYSKVWPDDGSASEPGSWQIQTTFNNAPPLDKGKVGLATLNTASSFDNVQVDHIIPGTILFADNFTWDTTGVSAPGWTNGAGSNNWQVAVDTSNNVLKQTDTSASNYHSMLTGNSSWRDSLISARFKPNSSNPNWEMTFFARYTDANNYVRLYVNSTAWAMQTVAGGAANNGSGITGLTFNSSNWYNVKFQITAGTLYGKVWQAGNAEPTTWQATLPFNQTAPLDKGKIGIATGNTPASFDDFVITTVGPEANLLNDDFNLDPVSSPAQNWTVGSGTWASYLDGSNVYKGTTTSYGKSATGNANWDHTLLTTRVKFATTDANRELSVFARYSNGPDAYGNMIRVVCNSSACSLQSHIGTVWGTAATLAGIIPAANTWYKVKMLVTNGVALAKVWQDGSTEPVDWQGSIIFNNTGAIRHGKVGYAVANNGTATAITAEFDDLVVSNRVLGNDFEDGTAGSSYASFSSPAGDTGNWQVKQPAGAGTNKEYQQTVRPSPANDVMMIAYNNTTKWADAVIAARMKYNHTDTGRSMSLMARFVDVNNFVRIGLLDNAWVLQARIGGVWVTGDYVLAPSGSFSAGSWYNVKISLSQGEVSGKVWKEGDVEPAYTSSLSFNATGIGSGYVGFESANTDPSFDSLVVNGQPYGLENNLLREGFDKNAIGTIAAGWGSTGGSWQVLSSNNYQQTNNAAPFNATYTGDINWKDYTLFTHLLSNSSDPNRDTSILARYTDINNFVRIGCISSGCYLQTRIGGAFGTGAQIAQLLKGGTAIPALTAGVDYRAKLQVSGNTAYAKVWPDGSPEPSSWMATISISGLANGKVGYASQNDYSTFDDLAVTLQ